MNYASTELQRSIQIHGIVIDPLKWRVLVDGAPISFTSQEFRLLHLLARNPGRFLTRHQILYHIHGPDYSATEHTVNVEVLSLRKKLGERGKLILTKRGVGYGFLA
jgi:DNA-binding response OmpR family regulator